MEPLWLCDAVALDDPLGGGFGFGGVENDAAEGIAFLEDHFVKAVFGMFARFDDVVERADFSAVHAFQNQVAGVLVTKVELVGQYGGEDDGAGHVEGGFLFGKEGQAEGGAALPIVGAPTLEIRDCERLKKQTAEEEIFGLFVEDVIGHDFVDVGRPGETVFHLVRFAVAPDFYFHFVAGPPFAGWKGIQG